MKNYFRITSYNPQADVSFIIDSINQFEELWQFSAAIVAKNCRILEISDANLFDDGNIPKATPDGENFILRACMKGRVVKENGVIKMNGRYYKPIK